MIEVYHITATGLYFSKNKSEKIYIFILEDCCMDVFIAHVQTRKNYLILLLFFSLNNNSYISCHLYLLMLWLVVIYIKYFVLSALNI